MKIKNIVTVQALVLGVMCAIPGYAAMNPPSAAECAERTGKSEAECTEMMENFKNMKPPEGMAQRGAPTGSANNPQATWPPRNGEQKKTEVKNTEAKQGQHWRLERISTHLEKIISFLESKNVDVATLKENFQTFKDKVSVATTASEKLAQARSEGSDSEIQQARTELQTANQDAIKYYRETLIPSIKEALNSIR